MDNNTEQLKHALNKIEECAKHLMRHGLLADTIDYRHNIYQLGYNAGRLSEMTGLGREVYDTIKPEMAHGIINGYSTIANVIVPAYRRQLGLESVELPPSKEEVKAYLKAIKRSGYDQDTLDALAKEVGL